MRELLKDENGKAANWKLEMGSLENADPVWRMRPGDTVKRGDQVTVQGFRAKDSWLICHWERSGLSQQPVNFWVLHRNAQHVGIVRVAPNRLRWAPVLLRECCGCFRRLRPCTCWGWRRWWGTVAVFDLRLLGWMMRRERVSELTRRLLPWSWLAVCSAASYREDCCSRPKRLRSIAILRFG